MVYDEDIYNNAIGVNKKILGQIKALNDMNLNCSIKEMVACTQIVGYKILYRLPFSNLSPVWKFDDSFKDIDYIYMRRPLFMNVYMRRALLNIKKINSKVKIIMELPTYPYDKEILTKLSNYPIHWKDMYNRNRLRGIVDRIAILSDDKEIWGIPTLHINNGIVLDDYEVRKPNNSKDINLIAVAIFKEWHGYERVIKGLHQYYCNGGERERKVFLHMVGEGSELPLYKKLVAEYHLKEYVLFYGLKNQNDINIIYDKCDIALSSFGAYKKDIFLSKELKSREYLAKGIPIVSGCQIDIFDKKNPYYLEMPNDQSTVNIMDIVTFYDSIYLNKDGCTVINDIRKFANKQIGMAESMKPVIDYIMERK